jgi:predicted RNA-binding protein with EMAP domain
MMGVLEGVLQRIRYQLMHNENLLEQVKNNLNQLDEIQKTLELEEKY